MLQSSKHSALVLEGARIIDPIEGRDEIGDVFVVDGKIAQDAPVGAKKFDASGRIVCPGLWDMHVHLREPGQEHKETIESGTAAAAAGGFTAVACMPNTSPAMDTPEAVRFVLAKAASAGSATVFPTATISRNREGKTLTDFAALQEAGAVAFTDDGDGVEDDGVMLAAFELAARLDTVLIQHCEYRAISDGGVMHLGEVSRQIDMPGLDPRSEEDMIERDIDLCRKTGGRYHVAHISTARAIDLVRHAKREGLPVTSEVCTHHILLTDEACRDADPNTKMHPPLRPQYDVDACRQGLLDGTIDCIITDHAPHAAVEKNLGFLKAPAGIVGLETAVGVAAEAMIATGLADWRELITWFTAGPSDVLRLSRRGIVAGNTAELTLIDPNRNWRVVPEAFLSKGQNTPFGGIELTGKAVLTIRGTTVASLTE